MADKSRGAQRFVGFFSWLYFSDDRFRFRFCVFPLPDNHQPGEVLSVHEFERHVRNLHANGDLLFSQEYSALKPNRQFTWDNTLDPDNRIKNRYNNIVAYDHSRVRLSRVAGVPGSDYVNANYLDGYQKRSAYIASQGPLPETCDDFWRMIWEQASRTIVMVTVVFVSRHYGPVFRPREFSNRHVRRIPVDVF